MAKRDLLCTNGNIGSPENFAPYIPLHEYLSPQYQTATTPWVQKVFAPLPPEEAEASADYMD